MVGYLGINLNRGWVAVAAAGLFAGLGVQLNLVRRRRAARYLGLFRAFGYGDVKCNV